MAFLQWTDSYSVGVPTFDTQHKRWIELINALHEAMLSGRGAEVVGRVYKEMMDYTKVHFGEEERLMRETNYPNYNDHKAAHDGFVREIEQKLNDTSAANLKQTLDAMTMLRQWLVNHIQKKDKQYTNHFQEAHVG